jgi:hypothetical protein
MPTVSLDYLASHARNLESLLQTYRQINLTTQSVFLILGTFILSRVLEATDPTRAFFLETLLISITVFSNVVMARFGRVIHQRGDDINWWYHRIIRKEQSLPPEERFFTQFKIHQSRERFRDQNLDQILHNGKEMSDPEIELLLDADLDQVRRVINTYILRGIRLIWLVIILISLGGVAMNVMG